MATLNKNLLFIFIPVIYLASSCVDDDLFTFEEGFKLDESYIKDAVWDPAFAAPIGRTSLDLNRQFQGFNSQITLIQGDIDSLSSIVDTMVFSEGSDSTIVIYNDSIYLSELPTMHVDTTVQFQFGDLTTLEKEDFTIKYVNLIFNITNGYPTQIKANAQFLDANNTVIYTLFQNGLTIEGSEINEEGRVVKPRVNDPQPAYFTEEMVEDLIDTRRIWLTADIWLKDIDPENFDEVMKFFSDYRIDVQIAVDFQIEVRVGSYLNGN